MATTSTARRILPNLPTLPKGRAATSWNGCRCGCGGNTQSTFVPGHDARLKGMMIRVLRDVLTLDEIEESYGGKNVRHAVETALQDPKLIKRWNLEEDVEAAKVRAAAKEEEDADEDDTDEDDAEDAEGDEATE